MKHSVAGSVGSGMKNTWNMTVMMYKVIKQLFTGDVSVSELSGPVGIVYAVNQSAKAGVIYVVYLASLLSLNLAIMNMLPFPALDGGRLLFLLIRKITGKRITDAIEGKIHFIGIILLMAPYGICDLERYRQIHRTYIQLMPGDAGRQEGYVI